MKRPNVLLLAIDSLRADVAFGGEAPTPNLDSHAARGASFHQCVSTTTTTTPSFASMLTGCYPPKHGVRGLQGYRLASDLRTLAEAFAAAGYSTHAEATGPLLRETGVLRGFDDARHRPGYRVPFFGWRDDVVARIRTYEPPWFMLLHVWEVHRPFRSPPDFEKRWDRAGYLAAVSATDDHLGPVFDAAGEDTLTVITGDHGEEYPNTEWERLVVRGARKLRRMLKPRRGSYLDRTLSSKVVGHGYGIQEALVRVPLVISGPGTSSRVVDDQVRHVDLFPTLADLCGLDPPQGIDGRSLRPLIEGSALPEEPAYMEAVGVKLEGERIEGARTPDWKLQVRAGERPELFRLSGEGGPDEKRNLYSRHPEVGRHLHSFVEQVAVSGVADGSGMTSAEEAVVEQHLKDLGYL